MIVCPVCEHAQARAAECEVCGKPLDAPGVAAGSAADPPPLDLLEPTRHAAIGAVHAPLLELEPTLHTPVDAFTESPTEIEPTRAAPVDVDAPPAPDLERTEQAGIPGDRPTPVPASVVCRYCRTEALPGERICDRCGMRLPVLPGAVAARGARTPPLRHCSCGLAVRGWSACPGCGGRIASE